MIRLQSNQSFTQSTSNISQEPEKPAIIRKSINNLASNAPDPSKEIDILLQTISKSSEALEKLIAYDQGQKVDPKVELEGSHTRVGSVKMMFEAKAAASLNVPLNAKPLKGVATSRDSSFTNLRQNSFTNLNTSNSNVSNSYSKEHSNLRNFLPSAVPQEQETSAKPSINLNSVPALKVSTLTEEKKKQEDARPSSPNCSPQPKSAGELKITLESFFKGTLKRSSSSQDFTSIIRVQLEDGKSTPSLLNRTISTSLESILDSAQEKQLLDLSPSEHTHSNRRDPNKQKMKMKSEVLTGDFSWMKQDDWKLQVKKSPSNSFKTRGRGNSTTEREPSIPEVAVPEERLWSVKERIKHINK